MVCGRPVIPIFAVITCCTNWLFAELLIRLVMPPGPRLLITEVAPELASDWAIAAGALVGVCTALLTSGAQPQKQRNCPPAPLRLSRARRSASVSGCSGPDCD